MDSFFSLEQAYAQGGTCQEAVTKGGRGCFGCRRNLPPRNKPSQQWALFGNYVEKIIGAQSEEIPPLCPPAVPWGFFRCRLGVCLGWEEFSAVAQAQQVGMVVCVDVSFLSLLSCRKSYGHRFTSH